MPFALGRQNQRRHDGDNSSEEESVQMEVDEADDLGFFLDYID